jgi:hypothetical protein
MRCPDCNKFVSFEQGEPEAELEASGASLTGTIRIVLTCQECSTELKESTFDVEQDLQDDAESAIIAALSGLTPSVTATDEERQAWDATEWDYEAEEESTEMTDRRETVSRKTLKSGKVVERPIKFQYQKQFYGYEAQVKVTVTAAGLKAGGQTQDVTADFTVILSDETQASGMEEMV